MDKDGKQLSKHQLLDDLAYTLQSERTLIDLVGRREAARVYGSHEGVTSAMQTVDYILTNDIVEYYRKDIANHPTIEGA